MKTLRIVILGIGLAALSSCASFRDGRLPDRTMLSKSETRVFYGECVRPVKDMPESFLIEAFGSAIISNTLGRIGKAIRAAGEEDAHPSTTSRNLEILPGNVRPCVQLVRGEFDDTATKNNPAKTDGLEFLTAAITDPDVNQTTVLQDIEQSLRGAGIRLKGAPDFFFEAQLSASANKSALSLVPSFYTYREPIKPGRSENGTYAMLVAFSFHPPGKVADAKEAAGASLALGALSPGETTHKIYDLEPGGGRSVHESPWFPTFASLPPKGSKTPQSGNNAAAADGAGGGNSSPSPEDTRGAQNDAVTVPLILSATVTETRKANEVLLFFADVFDGSQKNLQAELEEALIPSVRDGDNLADYTTEQTQRADYYSKYAAAEAAHDELCNLKESASGTERLNASAKLYAAQTAANVAAMTAGLPRPYEPLVEVSEEKLVCPVG